MQETKPDRFFAGEGDPTMPKVRQRELAEEFYCVRCKKILPREKIYLTMRYENDVPIGLCAQCKHGQAGTTTGIVFF